MLLRLLRPLGNTAKYVLIGLALLYLVDAGVFLVRQRHGSGLRSVSVEQYLQTPLKGQKAEYDYLGMVDENCSRTVFAQRVASQWIPPCWWLKRHTQRWE